MSLEFVLSDIPFRLVQMKALLAACKPLILLDFHRSFNDTRTMRSIMKGSENLLVILRIFIFQKADEITP